MPNDDVNSVWKSVISTTLLTMDHWFVVALISVTCSLTPVYSAPSTHGVICPPKGRVTGRFPHPSVCRPYYFCTYGKARLKECTPELEWNAKKSKCEEPDVAGCTKLCDPVANDPQGTWYPQFCSAGPIKVGTTCSLKCNKGYQLRGRSSNICKDFGWNSTNRDDIPKCVDQICLSQERTNAVKYAMEKCDGMLFVLDESGSIGKVDFDKCKMFVNRVVDEFPLSSSRTAGVITFDDDPMVHIHVTESSTANFQAKVNTIPYRGHGTLVLEALQCALQEIQTYRPGKRFLVILVTDGDSENDATPAADALKAANHSVLTIAVGKKYLNYVESLSSIGEYGIRHSFHARNYEELKSSTLYIGSPSAAAAEEIKKKCGVV